MGSFSIWHWLIVIVLVVIVVLKRRRPASAALQPLPLAHGGIGFGQPVPMRRGQRVFNRLGMPAVFIPLALFATFWLAGDSAMLILQESQKEVALLALAGAGLTLVMLTGRIDLSVGGTMTLSAVAMAWLSDMSVDEPLPVVLGLAAGLLIGFVNALLVIRFGLPSFLVTLCTGQAAFYLAVAASPADGFTVAGSDVGLILLLSGGVDVLGINITTGLFVALAVILGLRYLLKHSGWGQRVRSVREGWGDSESVSAQVSVFVLSGALAALAGWLLLGQYGSVDTKFMTGQTLEVVVAVLAGGVSVYGGVGSMTGVLLGAVAAGILSMTGYMFELGAMRQVLVAVLVGALALFHVVWFKSRE